MSLQLYQVDYKSYLLDFKSLVEEEAAGEVASAIAMDGSAADRTAASNAVSSLESQVTGHHTMEFFEMCAALITQLAR
jgi:5'-AMP-activated protein kinase catalytic alpha subunit